MSAIGSQEWSRSRFWLCHFLNNRHQRQAIDWSENHKPEALGDLSASRWHHRRRLLARVAAQHHQTDPAFVQSLRLLVKEEQHHALLLCRCTSQTERSRTRPAIADVLIPLLGPRFEFSIMLLTQLIDLHLLRLVQHQTTNRTAQQVCAQIIRDKRQHAAFCAERLTLEYADFNFLRRNLRRLRLRVIFALLLLRHRRALHGGVGACWSVFSQTLERVVPYRRDALLAALLNQREKPYGAALLSEPNQGVTTASHSPRDP